MPDDKHDGFDDSDVPELSYNFSKWELSSGKVLIPEPSVEQVTDFFSNLARLQVKMSNRDVEPEPEKESDADRDARIERELVTQGQIVLESEIERANIYAAVCSNAPNAEILLKLPLRPRRAFYGYVQGMLRPEA